MIVRGESMTQWRCKAAGLILLMTVCLMIEGCEGSKKPVTSDAPIRIASGEADSEPTKSETASETSAEQHASPKSGTSSRDAPVFRFESMRDRSGIDFVQQSGNSKDKPFPAANGTGAGAIDVDADGAPDLYFANGAAFPLDPNGPGPWDRLYRNHGDWKFSDITNVAGIGSPGYSCGVAVGDIDNDGFSDLYVNRYGVNLFYRNLGDGTFEECATACGIDDPRWGTSAAFVDYNEDGLTDLYVCNYGKWTWETNQFCGDQAKGIRMFCSPTHVEPEDDALFANNGDGTFRDVAQEAGIRVPAGRGQGVIAGDFNGDSHVDLYVSNDIHPNFLFLNTGGKFEESADLTGTALDHLGQAQAGMGLAAADVNADGRVDLFVTNYQNEHNALYLNLSNDTFLESGLTRIPEGSLPWVGWGTAIVDIDLDGEPDILVTNGHTDDNLAELGREGEYRQPPGIWRNSRGQFEMVHAEGQYFATRHVGRGLVSGDFDNDGDTDFVICHQDEAPELLDNQSTSSPEAKSVSLLLRSHRGSRRVTGATLATTGEMSRAIPVTSGGSYASSPDERVIIAAEGLPELSLNLRWCNSSAAEAITLETGKRYLIVESTSNGVGTRILQLPESF